MGRSHQAEVDRHRPGRAHRHDFPLLQDAQQRRLRWERQVADLIEKERAVIRGTDETGTVLAGAGECSLPEAEELGLDQGSGKRTAIDGLEGAGTAGKHMQSGRDELFAGSALPRDQHRNVGGRHRLQLLEPRREQRRERRERWFRRRVLQARDPLGIHPGFLAKEQERLPELDQVTVGERRLLDAFAIDERPVPRLAVLDCPGAEHLFERRVGGRYPRIGKLDRQPMPFEGKAACLAPPDLDVLHAAQDAPGAAFEGAVSLHHDEEVRTRDGSGCASGFWRKGERTAGGAHGPAHWTPRTRYSSEVIW